MAPTRPRKIANLTPEQEAMLPVYAERWTKIGLSTEPADRPAAEAAIHEMYRFGGLEPPKQIAWCGSPLAMMRQACKQGNLDDSWAGFPRESHVRDAIENRVSETVRIGLARIRYRVMTGGSDGITLPISFCIIDSVASEFPDAISRCVGGQNSANWLASYEFLSEQCGLIEETAPLQSLWALARSAGWALPFRNACYVSERISQIRRDLRGELHCADGPALSFGDGWSIYVWHGIRIAPDIIEKRFHCSPSDILAEPNAEFRRVRIEIYADVHGSDSLVRDFDAQLLAEDEAHGRPRRLYEVPGLADARLLVVENGTQDPDGDTRTFSIFVPSDMKSPHEAVAWTYGYNPDEYSEVLRS